MLASTRNGALKLPYHPPKLNSSLSARQQFFQISPCTTTTTTLLRPLQIQHYSNTRPHPAPSTTRLSSPPSTALNPPTSTLPPPLSLPARSPSQSSISYYFTLGKSYLTFYKTGARATWTNYRACRSLLARLPQGTSPRDAARQGLITRSEWQLVRRTNADMKLVPVFALVFLVCGEFTPLVVLVLGGVVPRTCRIPRQVEGGRRKGEERRGVSFREGTGEGWEVLKRDKEGEGKGKGKGSGEKVNWEALKPEESKRRKVAVPRDGLDWRALSKAQRLHVGRSLGLYGKFWDYIGGLPSSLLQYRANRWEDYIRTDDQLIESGGGAEKLDEEELYISCEERGLDVLAWKSDRVANCRRTLQGWIRRRRELGYGELLLRRPNVWGLEVRRKERILEEK
ncbi:MAG: hypothetical protein MMC23_001626 [Stictis urceolatum]|nr:hypothetical protein [Stictis urceolata]